MLPVDNPVPEVVLTPVVGDMLQVALEILEPESVNVFALPTFSVAPLLLATARPLGVGHGGVGDVTVNTAVAFAVVVVQEPVELAT